MKRSAGVSIQDRSRLFVKTEEKVTQQFKVKCTSILVRVCRGWGGNGGADASRSEGRRQLDKGNNQERHGRNPSSA